MVKKASTKSSSSAAPAESTPAKAPVKRVKKSVSTKPEEKVEVVEAVPQVPDFTQADSENTADASTGVNDHIGKQFEGIIQTLSTFRCTITALQAQIRGLEKAAKNRNKGNRRPSGFAKPSQVSPELCSFMKKEVGTEIARTEVTQYLIQYIKDNSLQFAGNKKIIVPDNTLKKLLNVKDGEEVTYFNLQRLMNRHFVKSSSSSASASTSA